jgi:hypothetical protein
MYDYSLKKDKINISDITVHSCSLCSASLQILKPDQIINLILSNQSE